VGDVLLGYLHPSEVTASFHKSLLDLLGHDLSGPRRLHSWAMIKCGSGDIAGARNQLAEKFLESECQWLFMIDADMGFAPHALDDLLSLADPQDRPIVGGLAFAQRESCADGMNGFRCFPSPTLFDYRVTGKGPKGSHQFQGRSHYPANTLVKTGATGGAFVLIHRTVFEQIAADLTEQPFEQYLDEAGERMGEDISFFDRCRRIDVPVHVHTGIRTTHYKHLWLAEDDFWQSFVAPPATERVDVIIPVLHRPQNVAPLMTSLLASTGLARAFFVCEADDVEEQDAVKAAGGFVLVDTEGGAHTFAEKVNFAYEETGRFHPAPWVLLVGDDVRFRPGWLDHAQDVHRRYGANVVGTNDLCNPRVIAGDHATHPLIRRSYVDDVGAGWDGPGIVCHEGYAHWFVDDEIVTAAKQRATFQAALGSQVEHLHPMNGGAPDDDVYAAGSAKAPADRALFERRLRAAVRDIEDDRRESMPRWRRFENEPA
jgi:GT2 family glycosyltransferase